jgi:hypothetical protein
LHVINVSASEKPEDAAEAVEDQQQFGCSGAPFTLYTIKTIDIYTLDYTIYTTFK